MKQINITANVYEVGDVLDVSSVKPIHKKATLEKAEKVMIVSVIEQKGNRYSYRAISDKGNLTTITNDEMRGEKYIGHVDLPF